MAMERGLKIVIAVASAGFLASAVALLLLKPGPTPTGQGAGRGGEGVGNGAGPAGLSPGGFYTPEPDAGLEGLAMPDFELTDHTGAPATQAIFDGQYTITDFIFTHCPLACPGMTLAMRSLQDDLAGTKVRFVSVSVDPVRDTPERLRAYAAENGADLRRWTFLTGSFNTVRRMCRDSLMFALELDPGRPIPLPDGSTMANIIHPSKFILVGPDRRVIGLYDIGVPGELDRLRDRARALAGG